MVKKKFSDDWEEKELKPYKGYPISKWRCESEESTVEWSQWFYTAWDNEDHNESLFECNSLEELKKLIDDDFRRQKEEAAKPKVCSKCGADLSNIPEEDRCSVTTGNKKEWVCEKCFADGLPDWLKERQGS